MDIKYIKIGETYLLPVTVTTIEKRYWIEVETVHDYSYKLAPSEVKTLRPAGRLHQSDYDWATKQKDLINLLTGRKNTETAPKYDPNRKFREGDEVRYVPCKGRECPAMPLDEYYREKTLTVVEDEDSNHQVLVRTQDGREKYIRFCYLQLVTPVEEPDPYYVEQQGEKTGGFCFTVRKRNGYCESTFYFGAARSRDKQQAKAAAEAECARLNAEYRKEQE